MIARFVLRSSFFGDSAVRNVFTVDGGPGTTPVAADGVLYMEQIWNTALRNFISIDWSSQALAVEIPDGAGHWGLVEEVPCNLVGLSAVDMLPRQMAAVIVGITASRRRGKKFIAGLTEGTQNFGQLETDVLVALNNSAQSYVTPDESGMVHPFEVGVCKPDGTDFLHFTSYRADHLMGTQRRRKAGVGM